MRALQGAGSVAPNRQDANSKFNNGYLLFWSKKVLRYRKWLPPPQKKIQPTSWTLALGLFFNSFYISEKYIHSAAHNEKNGSCAPKSFSVLDSESVNLLSSSFFRSCWEQGWVFHSFHCHLLLLIQASVTRPNILANVRVSPHERTALVWSVCFIQNGQDSINVGQLIWLQKLQIEFCTTEFFLFIVSTDKPIGSSLTVWYRRSTALSATLHRNVQVWIKPTFLLRHHRRVGGLPPPRISQPWRSLLTRTPFQ